MAINKRAHSVLRLMSVRLQNKQRKSEGEGRMENCGEGKKIIVWWGNMFGSRYNIARFKCWQIIMCRAECQDCWHRWNSQVPKRVRGAGYLPCPSLSSLWAPKYEYEYEYTSRQAEGNHLIEHLALNYHRHWDRVVVTITNWRYIIFQQSLKLTSQKK